MPIDILPRGQLTDALVAHLRAYAAITDAGILVGDGIGPDQAGWMGGQADVGSFVPSVILRTLPSQANFRETVKGRHTSWSCGYGLKSVGGARGQADYVADLVRSAVLAFSLGDAITGWHKTDLVFTSLAGVDVVGNSDPPTWELDDSFVVWMDRKRS